MPPSELSGTVIMSILCLYLNEDAGAPKEGLANMIYLKFNWDDYFEGTDLKTLQINMLVSASLILKNHYNEG